MEDVPLKRAVTDLLEIFKPIGIALDKLQSDTCTVGSVFQIWNEVCVGSPAEYAEKVAKRAKAALSPEILAANLFHIQKIFSERVILGSNHLFGGRLGEGLDSLTRDC